MRALWLMAPLLWGCAPDEAVPPIEEGYVEPLSFRCFGAFGYDDQLDAAVPYALGDDEPFIQPWMELDFEVLEPDGTVTDCKVTLHTADEGPIPRSAWADAEGMAIDVPQTASPAGSCRDWDPEVWGDNPARTLAAEWSWGFGVGATPEGLEAALSDQLEDESWEEHWEPYIFGGQLRVDMVDAPLVGPGYSFGYAVDDSFVMQYEEAPADPGFHNLIADAVPIEAEQASDGQLPRGVYVVLGLEAFDVSVLGR